MPALCEVGLAPLSKNESNIGENAGEVSSLKMVKKIKKTIDRFGGPLVSIMIHVIVIAVLVNAVVFQALETSREIEVQVMAAEDNLELDEALQTFDELPPDERLSAADEPDELPDPPVDDFSAESMDLAELTMSVTESPLIMKGLFAGRTDAARTQQLKKFAGGYGEQVEAAVVRGLEWLASQQHPDGLWGEKKGSRNETKQRRVRVTSLCLLAFLAHGETPQSEKFGDTVRRAIEFLRVQQHVETGLFVPLSKRRPVKGGEDLGVYAHAQATYALAEAYALTRAPALKRPVERGLQVIIDGQLESGAWGNWYEQNISDSSATSWQIQACKAAEAAGIRMEGLDDVLKKAEAGVA
ncbi:MAG: terpene cyclase/mutase family protein, partial [Victivallales bacterium]|nr:terpene cyclase/mutase family protein [Victivallales bacterium]